MLLDFFRRVVWSLYLGVCVLFIIVGIYSAITDIKTHLGEEVTTKEDSSYSENNTSLTIETNYGIVNINNYYSE